MIKKILFTIAACALLGIAGCETAPTVVCDDSILKITTSAAFNQEAFVWESFLFPTNRTTGLQ